MIECRAILFDMDGTLVDSTQCVEAIWSAWAKRHDIPVSRILQVSHGRRTVDTLNDVAPHLDTAREAMLIEAEEVESKEGIEAVPGAVELLSRLPCDRWAVVTSASRPLATVRLQCAGLPVPDVLVCAEDVMEGKPNPAGYLMAASLLGVEPLDCLIVEDTPAGILAGRAAGMKVLGITTTYPASTLLDAVCVRDFRQLEVLLTPRGMNVVISAGR